MNVLLVEDEPSLREMMAMALERAGHRATVVATAEEAERAVADARPDVILLDWMLPSMSGVELARRLRRDEYTREVPIIMLTARCSEDDRIHGLEAGADDYVTKPFSPRELMARMKAVLRRTQGLDENGVMEIGGITLDFACHRVMATGRNLEMSPTEFRLLQFFMGHPERVYSRGQLLDMVWGRGSEVEERTVDVHIRRLRNALAPTGHDRYIQTVRGTGYRFSTQA